MLTNPLRLSPQEIKDILTAYLADQGYRVTHQNFILSYDYHDGADLHGANVYWEKDNDAGRVDREDYVPPSQDT